MADDLTVSGSLTFDAAQAVDSLQRAADALEKLAESSKSTEEALTGFTAVAERLNGTLELFAKGLELVERAIEPFIDFIRESIDAAEQDELAIQKLNAALEATDAAATSEELIKFAEAEAEVSTQSKDAVIGVERLLTLLTDGKGNIEELTQASLDLAAGLGINAESAARALGKAMEGNVTALKRFGITLDDTKDSSKELKGALEDLAATMGTKAAEAAKKYGEALIDDARGTNESKKGVSELTQVHTELEKHFSGEALAKIEQYAQSMLKVANSHEATKTKAQQAEEILKKVQERFGGQAQAEASTFSGLVTRVAHSYEELQIAVGNAIIKSEPLRNAITFLADEFTRLGKFVDENRTKITEWVNSAVELAFAAVDKLLKGLEALAAWAGLDSLKDGFAFLTTEAEKLNEVFEGSKSTFDEIKKSVIDGHVAFTNISKDAQGFGDAMKDAGVEVTKAADGTQKFASGWDDATKKAIASIDQQKTKVGELDTLVLKLGDDATQHPVRPVLEENKFVTAWNALVRKIEDEAVTVGGIIGKAIVDGIIGEIQNGASTIVAAIKAAIKNALSGGLFGEGPGGAPAFPPKQAGSGGAPTVTSPAGVLSAGALQAVAAQDVANNPDVFGGGGVTPSGFPAAVAGATAPGGFLSNTPLGSGPDTVGGSITSLTGGADALAAAQALGQVTISGPTYEPQISMSPAVPFVEGIGNMRDHLGAFIAAAGGKIDFAATMSGSPSLPFTEYLTSYAPGVLANFARNTPQLTLETDWAKKAGDEYTNFALDVNGATAEAFKPFIELLGQGLGANPGALAVAAAELKAEAQHERNLVSDLISRGGNPADYRGYNSTGAEANAVEGLASKIEALLRAIESQHQASQPTADRTALASDRAAAAASRTAAATERIASILSGGFGAVVTQAADATMRQATGNRELLYSSGR